MLAALSSSRKVEAQEPVDASQVTPVAPPRKRRSQDFGGSSDMRPMSLMDAKDYVPNSGSEDQMKAAEEPGSRVNRGRPPYQASVSADFQAEIKKALKAFPIEEQEEEEEAKEEEKGQEHGRIGKVGEKGKSAERQQDALCLSL